MLTGRLGEGPPSKRLQKDSQKDSSNSVIPSRPAEPTPLAGIRPDPFPTPATRRRQSSFRDQTFREQRALHAPSTLQATPSKRYENLALPLQIRIRECSLTYSGRPIAAFQIPKLLNEPSRPILKRSPIPGNLPLTTRQGSASPRPLLLGNVIPRSHLGLLSSSHQSISITFTLALPPMSPTSLRFRRLVGLQRLLALTRMNLP